MQLRITPSNVIATVALLLSVGGTSYAAATITGAQIKDGSITSADVKNRSLGAVDLSAAALKSLRGPAGATGTRGATGPQGERGDVGPAGARGADGAPAKLVASYATEIPGTMAGVPGFDRYVSPLGDTPNQHQQPWHTYDNSAGDTDSVPADAVNGDVSQPPLNGTSLNNAAQTNLLSLTDGQINGGQLNVNFDSYVTGTAAITLLHKGSVHTRAECQLFVSDGLSLSSIGESVWVSSNQAHELVTVSLVGTKSYTASPTLPKQYNVIVRCRNGDKTPSLNDDWEYVRGNLTAFAAMR